MPHHAVNNSSERGCSYHHKLLTTLLTLAFVSRYDDSSTPRVNRMLVRRSARSPLIGGRAEASRHRLGLRRTASGADIHIMHMLICALACARNKEEATRKAGHVFQQLCDEGSYDYYSTLDDTDAQASWPGVPVAVPATTQVGGDLIDEALRQTQVALAEDVADIRRILASTPADGLTECYMEIGRASCRERV